MAFAVSAALPASHPASHPASGPRPQLAAWTVARQADGSVRVTIRELRDPAGLQHTLRADGVPASVTFTGQRNPACQGYPGGGSQSQRRHLLSSVATPAGGRNAMVIHPSALPSGARPSDRRPLPALPGATGQFPGWRGPGAGQPAVHRQLAIRLAACRPDRPGAKGRAAPRAAFRRGTGASCSRGDARRQTRPAVLQRAHHAHRRPALDASLGVITHESPAPDQLRSGKPGYRRILREATRGPRGRRSQLLVPHQATFALSMISCSCASWACGCARRCAGVRPGGPSRPRD